MLTQESLLSVWILPQPSSLGRGTGGWRGTLDRRVLRAKLMMRVLAAALTEISKCYESVPMFWLRNGSLQKGRS